MSNIKDILFFCNNTKLLFIEDNETARIHTVELLSRFFSNITTAENGEEALQLFKENDIDLIISDINMPKMNGIDMSEQVRKINKDVPIVLLSAHNETYIKDSANNAGITTYLEKPLNLEKFIEILTNLSNKQ